MDELRRRELRLIFNNIHTMRTILITIILITLSSCSNKTNMAVNNCKSGIPGNCPACAYSDSKNSNNTRTDENLAFMNFVFESL
jgi:hypothetical protein